MDSKQELEEQVRSLTQTVDEMRGRIARLEGEGPADGEKQPRRSRRGFLRLGAGAAVGALGLAAGKVLPAAAADTAPVLTGATVTGEHPTVIAGDAATAVPVLQIKDPGFLPADLTATGETFVGTLQGLGGHGGTNPLTATAVDGVDGFAEGVRAFGVYGLTDAGVGVVGESSTGIGLYARSSGRILQDPLLTAGIPAFAANSFEQVRDSGGEMWISTPLAAVPWKRLATLELFPNPRRIYDGNVQPTAPGTYGPVDATMKAGGGASGVPAGARAAFCAVQSYNAGVMTLFPDLTTDPGIANWSGTANGPLNLLYMFVPLSAAAKFKLHTYFTGKKYIDVWGFYM